MATLEEVKKALGITGNFQDETLAVYFDEVVEYIKDAGAKPANITSGVVARGVSDLWNYGAGDGKLSPAFKERVIQIALKK